MGDGGDWVEGADGTGLKLKGVSRGVDGEGVL